MTQFALAYFHIESTYTSYKVSTTMAASIILSSIMVVCDGLCYKKVGLVPTELVDRQCMSV